MNKPHLFNNLAIACVSGVITATGIFTLPVQAFVFESNSTLGWQSQTNNFFRNVPRNPVDGDTFDVTFNPTFPNIFVTAATGSFASGFNNIPPFDTLSVSPVGPGTFEYDGVKERYILQNNLTWDFGSRTLTDAEGIPDNGNLLWTIPVGTEFLVSFDAANSVEVDLCTDICVSLPYFTFKGDTYGAPPNSGGEVVMGRFQDTLASTFQFSDLSSSAPGNYLANSLVTPVPEPVTILGFFIFGGLALGLKSKKQC